MSVHGVCFDNGMSGLCNHNCKQFLDGDCDVGEEIVADIFNTASQATMDEVFELIEPVKLFTLRGAGKTDLEILTEIFGY